MTLSHRLGERTRIGLAGLGLVLVGLWQQNQAKAHALLVVPSPRDQQDGYKDPPRPPGTGAPCGVMRAAPPAQPQTTFTSGQRLNVTWKETVSHPGCFVIDFASANDASFQVLAVKSHMAAAGGTPRSWNVDVVLPNAPCAACTLRLRQLMLAADVPDSMCPPAKIAVGDTYYSCSNIVLAGAGGAADAGAAEVGGPGQVGAGGAMPSNAGSSGGQTGVGGRPASATGGSGGTVSSSGGDVAGPGTGGSSLAASGGAPATASGGAIGAPGTSGGTGAPLTPSASGGAAAVANSPTGKEGGGCTISGPASNPGLTLTAAALLAVCGLRLRRRKGPAPAASPPQGASEGPLRDPLGAA